ADIALGCRFSGYTPESATFYPGCEPLIASRVRGRVTAMAKNGSIDSQGDLPTAPSVTDGADSGSSPRLRGLDSNPEGHFGPRCWQAVRDSVAHIYDTVSLPDPSEEARFTLSGRTYATPRGILMRCEGTAFSMTRGPALAARGADQLLIVLQI